MTARRDDDAFAWEGDDDPTLDTGGAVDDATSSSDPEPEPEPASGPEPAPALPEGYAAVGKGADEVGRVHADGTVTMPGDRAPMGNAALIVLGVLGGVYLIYTIGWVIGGLRLQGTAQYLVSPVAYQFALWLAVFATPLWFAVAFLLTRTSKTWVRIVWLLAGAVLLVPWPFIMTGAVGQ